MVLLDYIKNLEDRNSWERGQQIIAILQEWGIQPVLQNVRFPRIRNIIIDFAGNPESRRLVLSAHYDVVAGSPGANDNASGVAVLLGLCQYLKKEPAPVRIIFFDREEAWFHTPLLRLGLLGSLYYVLRNRLKNISAIYNLELVGRGDFLSIWPVKKAEQNLYSVQEIEKAADDIKMPYRTVHIPWFILSSDHLSFRLKHMPNAVSLSLVPASQLPVWEKILASISLAKILSGWRPNLPEPLSLTHSSRDSSANVDEKSLQLMFSLMWRLISEYHSQSFYKAGIIG